MINNLTFDAAIIRTLAAQKILRSAISPSPIRRFKLDGQLIPSPLAEVRIVLNGSDTKMALSIAVKSGNGIIGALNKLMSSAKLAQHDSMVASFNKLIIDQTRVSRLNLNADTNLAIALIDRLVAKSEVANANFISSTSPNIRIKTTRFGGTLNVIPQPLDSSGLGLSKINLLTRTDAAEAEMRLKSALNSATRRTQGLEMLQRAITSGSFLNRSLASLIDQTSGVGLPAGTLVNILG